MRKRSYVFPQRTNAAVVPEKYQSASCEAHAGNHVGRSVGRRGWTSGIIPEDSAEIGFENGRWLFELFAKAGQVLQFADSLFGLSHAFRRGINLAAQEVRILAVDRHLG